MTTETSLEENIETTPSKDAGKTEAQPQRNWQDSYKGLQTLYNKLEKKYDALQAEYTSLNIQFEEATQTIKNFNDKEKTYQGQITQLGKEKENLTAEVSTHKLSGERVKLILQEFPELTTFEAKGLLPNASTVEEMRTKFTDFKSAFEGVVGDTTKSRLQGITAKGSGNKPGSRSKDDIYMEMNRYAGARPGSDDYRKFLQARDEWDEANKE